MPPDGLQTQIATARQSGYSDDDIAQYLSQSDQRVSEALKEGHSSRDVLNFLSGTEPLQVTQGAPLGGQITGISAGPQKVPVNVGGVQYSETPDPVSKWLTSVKNDINNGTDVTGIGKLMKGMGAHGLNVGGPQDFLPNVTKMAGFLFGGPELEQGGNPLPSTTRAAGNFQELEGAIGQHTVAMTDKLKDAFDDLKEFTDVTGRNPPPVVNKLMTRMADTTQPPLTYKEARMAYSDLSDLSVSDKMQANAKMNRLLIPLKKALGDSIAQTTDQAGKLGQYQEAMKEFFSASRITDFGQKIKDALSNRAVQTGLGVAGGGAAATALYNAVKK